MPNLEEILPELNNAKYFSKIDLREGYDQIELDLSSRHVIAFITRGGISVKTFSLWCKTSIWKFSENS